MTALKIVGMYIASDGPPCFTDVGILRKVGFLIFEATKNIIQRQKSGLNNYFMIWSCSRITVTG